MSTIFELYPMIQYPIDVNDTTVYKAVRDITSNIRLTQQTIDNTVNYEQRVLGDGESFEITANEVYEDPLMHALVMLANDRFDWRNDIPLTSSQFEAYVKDKYANPNGIHHFEDLDGNKVDNVFDDGTGGDFVYPNNIIPITNYEYELRINEAKRPIKVIKQSYSGIVDKLVKSKLQENE